MLAKYSILMSSVISAPPDMISIEKAITDNHLQLLFLLRQKS